MDKVILVDENNEEVGLMDKLEAHEKGLLHRAFSVFVFNLKRELLLQQRNKEKYHSGGLWTNTVCSHPKPGEKYEEAIHRRLKEEMGFDCDLEAVDCFIYKSEFKNGLTEHEYDCTFVGVSDSPIIKPDLEEVEGYKWINKDELLKDAKENPDRYTFWFKDILFGEKKIFKKIYEKI